MTGITKPTEANKDPVWRLRWLLFASCCCIAFAVTVAIVFLPTRWHWAPLWWGVVMTVGTLVLRQVVLGALFRRIGSLLAQRRDWFRRREKILIPLWVFMGAVVSVLAAAFNLIGIVIAMAAFMVLALGGSAAMVAVILRRRARDI